MTKHRFGGLWTQQKLTVLQEYLGFFTKALTAKPFKLVYIDTFAGTGKCLIKTGPEGQSEIDGSASIALNTPRPFDEYFFIEARRKHIRALQALKESHALGDRVHVVHGDARAELSSVLTKHNWRSTRGVLFLDPYGLQCSWEMVQRIAATKALDVFFLVSVSGITRQASTDLSKVDQDKERALTEFLGTEEWKRAWYQPPPQSDLFGDGPELVREGGVQAILQFVRRRMGDVFPHVGEPMILKNGQNAALFALFFAVSNDSEAAVKLASKVSREILSKLDK